MAENLVYDPLMNALDPQTCTVVSGCDVLRDPGLALMRRYLPVLAVIAGPYAGAGGNGDPFHPLDPAREWRSLLRLVAATQALQSEVSTRLALARLTPPTLDELGAILQVDGPDAFRVVHIVAHGEPDSLILEDAYGHEAIVRDAQLVTLFRDSAARLVILEGCFNHQLAHLLIHETPVQAVIGTRRRVPEADAITFGSHFYRQITAGSSVRVAFREALNRSGDSAAFYELVVTETLHEITLDLPEAAIRAERPLIAPGMPRMVGVPVPVGFVGRRTDLAELIDTLTSAPPDDESAICALQGPTGIGKTWLAAAVTARLGWWFSDGVLWFRANAVTSVREVIAAAARLIGLPAYAPAAEVQALLRERRVLIVLEDVDMLEIQAEVGRLIAWLRGIGPDAASAVVMTGRNLGRVLAGTHTRGVRQVRPYAYRDARTLAMQLAVARDLDVLDVDTIDDFLDLTLYIPWLIVQGIDLIEAVGMDATLGTFASLSSESGDPVGDYVRRRVQRLAADQSRALTLVVRAQGVPDVFDAAMARDLVGEEALDHLETLLNHGVLWIEVESEDVSDNDLSHRRYVVPPAVREYLAERAPLARTQQDLLDRAVMGYLARTWPQEVEPAAFETLDHVLRARLNTIRALIQRQLRPDILLDLSVMAHVLCVSAATFRAAGLAAEFVGYATGFRERLEEGVTLARLQIAMAESLAVMPGSEAEAAQLFRVTVAIPDLDPVTRALASHAYGKFLVETDQPVVAERMLQRVVDGLLAQRDPRTRQITACLMLDLANALALQEHHGEAMEYYIMAQRGFAAERDVVGSAEAQRDHSQTLIALGDPAQAEDMLRRALTAAEYVGRLDLAAEIRERLAELHTGRAATARRTDQIREERAELRLAEDYLSDAITDGLACGESPALAGAYLAMGRAVSRLDRLDEAQAFIQRGSTILRRLGRWKALASALVMTGQIQMARGNSVAALDALHEALDLADDLNLTETIHQAADVLVCVYQIRARHVHHADQSFVEDTLHRAYESLARLDDLGLDDQAAALHAVIADLEGA